MTHGVHAAGPAHHDDESRNNPRNRQPSAVEIDGSKLRELRKMNGDNLKTFAARAGVTFQFVSQLELGVRRRVSPPTFARICDALGVTDRHTMTMPQHQAPGLSADDKS